VSGRFCPACGQATLERRGPLLGLLGDFFSEFFSLDGRHLRTALSLWKPGRLTQLYLDGKRASYVPPVRVYLVASLLFFLLVGFPAPDAENFNVYVDDILIGRAEPDPGLGKLQLMNLDRTHWLGKKIDPYLAPQFHKVQSMQAQDLLDGFFAGLERTVPTTLVLFVPFLAAALSLLYFRRPFYYVDHLVFALHFQSFLFVLFVAARLVNMAGLARVYPGLLTYLVAMLFIAPAYLLLALKRIYHEPWGWTILKAVLLGLLYVLLIQPLLLVTIFLVLRAM
jgi:hypothetical protein